MVDAGHCSDVPEVFRRYLTEGKRPATCPTVRASPCDAVRWIHEAGGIAVIAHPARYPSPRGVRLITEFIQHGGRGYRGRHRQPATAADATRYTDTALEYGLLASGSDFTPRRKPHRPRQPAAAGRLR